MIGHVFIYMNIDNQIYKLLCIPLLNNFIKSMKNLFILGSQIVQKMD